MRRPRVYIAGPIDGSGRQFENLRRALDAATQLVALGCDPYIPHLDLVWQLVAPHLQVSRIQECDDNWLSVCDALYRLSGVSPGSDHEVAVARSHNLKVFFEGVNHQNPESRGSLGLDQIGAFARREGVYAGSW